MLTALQKEQPTGQQAEVVYISRQPPAEYVEMFAGLGDLITVAEMADVLDVCQNTVRNLIRTHELPGMKVGNRLYVPKAELVEYVNRQVYGDPEGTDGCAPGANL